MTLMRNIAVVCIVSRRVRDKPDITHCEHTIFGTTVDLYTDLFTNLFTTSLVEALTFLWTYTPHLVAPRVRPMWLDLAIFIPMSFFMEIVFDFFHYWTHRMVHQSRDLYMKVHRHHHRFKRPTPLSTFYQHPMDVFLTNSIPLIMSLFTMSRLVDVSRFQYALFLICKTYVETSGHSFKELSPSSSFIQCMWLPRVFLGGIQLYSEDHTLHHLASNCNYSKRFSLWDRVYGTYRSGRHALLLHDHDFVFS